MRPSWMWGALLGLLHGCDSTDPPSQTHTTQAPQAPTHSIALAFRPDLLVDVDVAPTSRAALGPVPEQWLIPRPFQRHKSKRLQNTFAVRAPYNITYYGQGRGKDGQQITVISPSLGTLRYTPKFQRLNRRAGTWSTRKDQILVHLPRTKGPPTDLQIRVPLATATETSMNFDTADRTPTEFVLRTLSLEDSHQQGLFLPAPSTASFRIEVPEGGQFRARTHLLAPPVDEGLLSDGASLRVSIDGTADGTTLGVVDLLPDQSATIKADLSEYAGQTVNLRLSTTPGGTTDLDYVFVSDPVVYTPNPHPRRALYVMVDTLRADHLGTYGYPRPTSPNMDAFAAQAVVFDQARAPSPWTLPSALAALYGRKPEEAVSTTHLGTRLAQAGWATCAITSNVWLTDTDTIAGGWSQYRGTPRIPANKQLQRAKACLQRHPNRDVFLFVHMIDPHLPYAEAKRFRGRFAGETPPGLHGRILTKKAFDAHANATTQEEKDAVRSYLVGRYDQNILAVDEAMGGLLELVGPEAPVMLTSDHGEELFDRGGYGHGHSLYDELVRVPLIIRTPTAVPRRVDSPVTLMDLVPTWLDVLGLPGLKTSSDAITGWSLTGLLTNTETAPDRFTTRALPMGRLIRSDDQWGVFLGHHKWTSSAAATQLFDLRTDPGEQTNLHQAGTAPPHDFPTHLGRALNQTVTHAVRIAGPGRHRKMAGKGSSMTIEHPDGLVAAWTRFDARGQYAQPSMDAGRVTVPWTKGLSTPREVFVALPEGSIPAGLRVTRTTQSQVIRGTVSRTTADDNHHLLAVDETRDGFTVGQTWQPIPAQNAPIQMRGQVAEELRALGYVE